MTALDLTHLAPLIVLSVTVLVLMLSIAFQRHHATALAITLIGLAAAFAESTWILDSTPRQIGILLMLDSFAYFYTTAFCAVAFVIALLAYDYFLDRHERPEEFYLLLLLGTIGCSVMVSSTSFVGLFLGLEILSVSLYAMIAYTAPRERSLEAATKYLILAGASSAFLVFGIALVYSQTGTLEYFGVSQLYIPGRRLLSIVGFAMILVGAGYKLAVVPFHLWTPDVYEGSPAPATAFIATASKGAMVGVMLRIFYEMNLPVRDGLFVTLSTIAIASMLIGNLLGLMQTNVKRMLAYSSIAHLGYVIVAFLASAGMAAAAATFYVIAYMATTLGAFGVISVLSNADGEAESLADYHALAWRRPGVAAVMCCMLLSLTGIPLTAGFIGKFYVVAAGAQQSLWLPLVMLVISSVIGAFYYIRLILVMFATPGESSPYGRSPMLAGSLRRAVTLGAGMSLGVLFVIVIWLGLYPGPLFLVLQQLL